MQTEILQAASTAQKTEIQQGQSGKLEVYLALTLIGFWQFVKAASAVYLNKFFN
jgi:hypothetical protein